MSNDGNEVRGVSRRSFVRQVGVGLALAATSCGSTRREGEAPRLDDKYLEIGLTGLARGGDGCVWVQGPRGGVDNRTGVFNAHWGAAVLATYFMCQRHPFDRDVLRAITKQLDRFIRTKEKFFRPFDREESDPGLVRQLTGAIDPTIHQYRQHGHVLIFAVHALAALKERPDLATPSVIDGIVNIARVVDKERGLSLHGGDSPRYKDEQAVIDTTFAHIAKFDGFRLSWRGDGVIPGNFLHWLTHTQAVLHLHRLGHGKLAKRAEEALRIHINRRPFPAPDAPKDTRRNRGPGFRHFYSMEYWGRPGLTENWRKDVFGFAHHLKLVDAYANLRSRVSNPDILPACDRVVFGGRG